MRADGLEGQLYREVSRLAEEHKNEILARYPKIMRRVSGYNLDEFIKSQPFNLSRIITGSEGTLADDCGSENALGAEAQVDGDGCYTFS